MKGKIVLLPFPFTNLTSTKRRPALVLLERPNDVVVAFISSKIPKPAALYQVIIDKNHKTFSMTGLKVSSTIYLDKIATIDKKLIRIDKKPKKFFPNFSPPQSFCYVDDIENVKYITNYL